MPLYFPMKTIRIYQAGTYHVNDVISLSEEAGQHIGIVLRMQPGEHLTLFSGDNREWDAEIVSVHKKKVSVTILAEHTANRESPRKIRLAQAISKGEKMEWVVQKAVELGVSEIIPLVTQHCAYKLDDARSSKKQRQWQSIAIAACEQSGRNQLPIIAPPMTLDLFLQQPLEGNAYILEPHQGKPWRDYATPKGNITLLIGPEGGFSEDEVNKSFTAGFSKLKLGPRILRTETAAVCALSVVQAIWGDL